MDMERPIESYGLMLQKYKDVDEDEILSSLTAEELLQLEGEIDREVLNKIPEDTVEDEPYEFSSSSNYSSTTEEEDDEERVTHRYRPKLSSNQYRQNRRSMEKQSSFDGPPTERKRRSSKTSHQFKIPPLKNAKSRENLKRQKSEEGGELKKELMQAVKQRSKRRTNRANSSGLSRRYTRKNSSCIVRKHRAPKVMKEDRKAANVNENVITEEMLSLRPKLKKVKTREPAKVNDMLHGVSLSHVTSGVKEKDNRSSEEAKNPSEELEEDITQSDIDMEYTAVDNDPPADEDVAEANDTVHRRLNTHRMPASEMRNDETMSSTTAGSTSAESYDVIGELSINSNSVEETMLRIWDDDETLTEVNLNNIQNVDMEVFEELASAMECNTHVTHLSLANVGLTDKPARALASMLKRNKTLEKLNVESNFITGDAALRMVAALRTNHTLTELRLANQRHIFGAKVEHEFSKILKDNKTLLRFGYQFSNPGPRMSASNSLTRNMDDVRKKRVTEQRRRAQAGFNNRPQLRKQPSSERYRRQRAEKIKQLEDEGIPLDLYAALQDGDMQKLLGHMNPSQFAMLEQWFLSRLSNQPEEIPIQNVKKQEQCVTPENSLSTPERQPTPKKLQNLPTPQRLPSPREELLESLRRSPETLRLKKAPSRLCDTPIFSDVESNPPSISVQPAEEVERPLSPIPPALSDDDQLGATKASDTSMDAASSSHGSDEIISWKEGEDYDSDEYEVVEIEVTESEEESADVINDVTQPIAHESSSRQQTGNGEEGLRSSSCRSIASEAIDDISSTKSTASSEQDFGRRKNLYGDEEEALRALDRLQIFDKYQHLSDGPKQPRSPDVGRIRKLNVSASPTSSTSSMSSLSPTTPRPVREDDSWITNGPFYKL